MVWKLPQLMTLADGSRFVKPENRGNDKPTIVMFDDGWLWAFVKTADSRIATSFAWQRWKPLTADNVVLALMSGLLVEDPGPLQPVINLKNVLPYVIGDELDERYRWKYSTLLWQRISYGLQT